METIRIQLFGTFRLPDVAPEKLGVDDRANYPADRQWTKLFALPFKSGS